MLELVNIHTYYGESQVLWGVSIKVARGSVAGILGRNGMGKTTIISSIIGFAPPRRGAIMVKGKDVTRFEPNRIARMGVALVPQGRRIFPSLSVRENLTMAARRGEQPDPWSLESIFLLFPRLEERINYRGSLLSGGEQQMLCIGRALMTNPDLLLMDEPSEGLAPILVQELSDTIKKLNNKGLSILLVEQNIRLALDVADYLYVVDKGAIVYESTPSELEKAEKVKEVYIGLSRQDS